MSTNSITFMTTKIDESIKSVENATEHYMTLTRWMYTEELDGEIGNLFSRVYYQTYDFIHSDSI